MCVLLGVSGGWCGLAGVEVSVCYQWWCTWTALFWFEVIQCGLAVRSILWSAMSLGGSGMIFVVWCGTE